MLAENYKDVINRLERYYRYRDPGGYDVNFKNRLQGFINETRNILNPSAKKFLVPQEWGYVTLLNNAAQLMVYYKCQGLARVARENNESSAHTFYLAHPKFVEAVNRNNVFAIHEQLICLSNLIQQCHDMQVGKIASDQAILGNLKFYQNKLIELNEKIEKLDGPQLTLMKNYLQFLSYHALIGALNLDIKASDPEFIVIEELIKKAMVQLYAAEDAANKQDPSNPFIDFHTFGEGLFARTPFQSFTQAKDYLNKVTGLSVQKQMSYYDLAKQNTQDPTDESPPIRSKKASP